MIARIGASTEKHPFTAHAQGMSLGESVPRTAMPRGKGMPIMMPAGMRITKERMIFVINGTWHMAPMISGIRRL